MTRQELLNPMTRQELLDRLRRLNVTSPRLDALIEDIQEEGVLDVQCPPDVAESMKLPRPARR